MEWIITLTMFATLLWILLAIFTIISLNRENERLAIENRELNREVTELSVRTRLQ